MQRLWPVLRMALRAVVWKSTPGTRAQTLSGFVLWLTLALAASVFFDLYLAEAGARFSPQGLTAEAGLLAMMSLVAAFFVRGHLRATFLCASLAIVTILSAVFVAAAIAGPMLC